MPQRLKPDSVKVLSFDFALVVRDEFAPAYGNGNLTDWEQAEKNGNNVYRAGNMMRTAFDKGYDPELTESDYETVKEAGRLLLRAKDSIKATGKYEIESHGPNLLAKAGQIIYNYSKRRDDKFAAKETGGQALLESVI